MATAIVGTLRVLLEANASKLESEFGKATVTVGNFDRFTQNAGRNLQRMVESFSGQRIVAEATTMAAAIEKVGGVSALSAQELRRVTSVVEQATAKLRAMGAEVPPSIAKLNSELQLLSLRTRLATDAVGSGAGTGGLTGSVQRLLPLMNTLGISLSVFSAINFGKQILQDADALTKLADKTGIGVEAIQRLKFAAEQSGNTLDQVTSAVTQMQNRLAEGDKSAVGALNALGLSFRDLENLTPDRQFVAIAREVAKIEDPMQRAKVAMDLFGRSGAEILPTLIADIDKLGDAAPQMSAKAVKAFDDLGDAISRSWSVAKVATAEGVASAIDGYTRLWQISQALMTGAFRRVPEILLDLGTTAPTVAKPVNALAKEVEGVGMSMEEMDRISKELTDSVEKGLTKGVRDASAAQKDFARETQKAEEAQRRFLDSVRATTPVLEAFLTPLKQGLQDSGQELQNIAAGFESDGTIIVHTLNEAALATQAADKATREWAQATGAVLAQSIQDTRDEIEETTRATQTWQQHLSSLATAFAQMAQVSDGAFSRIAGGIGRVITAIDTVVKSFQGLKDGIAAIRSGDLFSGILGVATSIAGMVGAVANLFRGWFGVSEEVKRARGELEDFQKKLRDTLTDTQRAEAGTEQWRIDVVRVRDAFLAVGRSEAEALAIVRQLWDTDHPEAMRRAMDEINRVLEEEKRLADEAAAAIERQEQAFEDAKQEASGLVDKIEGLVEKAGGLDKSLIPYIDKMRELGLITDEQAQRLRGLAGAVNWERMQEQAERFGIDLNSLGQRFQGARIGATAQDIINVFTNLTQQGASVGGVLQGMSDEISQLVRDSLRFGTSIPENMRPWIQELARTGQLLDAQGNKIENLDKLNFGPELKSEAEIAREGFQSIIAKIEELIDKITGPLTQALDNVTRDRTIHIDYTITTPPIPRDGLDRNIPFQAFAKGGLVTRPTLALIGESGPEMVIPAPDYRLQPVRVPDFPRSPWPEMFDRSGDHTGGRELGGVTNNYYTTNPVAVITGENRRKEDVFRDLDNHLANEAIGTGVVREALTSLIMDVVDDVLRQKRLQYGF